MSDHSEYRSSGTQTLVCLSCGRRPDLVQEEGKRDVARCPLCGVFGEYDEVVKAALRYAHRCHVYRQHQDILQRLGSSPQRKPNATGNFIQKRVIQESRRIPRPVAPDFVFK